ncbi:hypothetical protein C8R43DRAFT_944869 [Mycena crocata]|nr:hypothetical protein C8R43DRAFT_944869 [Mycena crocata]
MSNNEVELAMHRGCGHLFWIRLDLEILAYLPFPLPAYSYHILTEFPQTNTPPVVPTAEGNSLVKPGGNRFVNFSINGPGFSFCTQTGYNPPTYEPTAPWIFISTTLRIRDGDGDDRVGYQKSGLTVDVCQVNADPGGDRRSVRNLFIAHEREAMALIEILISVYSINRDGLMPVLEHGAVMLGDGGAWSGVEGRELNTEDEMGARRRPRTGTSPDDCCQTIVVVALPRALQDPVYHVIGGGSGQQRTAN